MDEIIKFYWLGQSADFPLTGVPEPDRHPLLVRRSVIEQHVPLVLQQLRDGKFVAAAWKSNEHISVILCHPNLAKGVADTLCVNTPALPRVVLNVEDWDSVSEASSLLLTAFGSEASSIDECAKSRSRLVDWLKEHRQPEMAATVRHFSNFPFGVRSDILDVIGAWRKVLIKGQKDQIDRFLEIVGTRFKWLGWSRDADSEKRLNSLPERINQFYCWASGEDNRPNVVLCLNRSTDSRIRGGTFDLPNGRASVVELTSEIQRVLAEVLEPAAAAVGLSVSYPRVGPISSVSENIERAMTAFAEEADGHWPLSERMERKWRDVFLAAKRDNAAFDPKELMAWFMANGWNEDGSRALVKQFYSASALLEEYEEGRQPA